MKKIDLSDSLSYSLATEIQTIDDRRLACIYNLNYLRHRNIIFVTKDNILLFKMPIGNNRIIQDIASKLMDNQKTS